MNIFLTGGTGFIGSHFINAAHQAGHNIFAIRRKNSNPKVKIIKEPFWIEGDLIGDYIEYYKKCDVLVHFAAHSANVPYDTLENCIKWNVEFSFYLIKNALRAGIEKFLISGSCFEYGRSGDMYEFIPPDAPLLPTQTYPTSKAMANTLFYGWGSINNLYLKILRVFQVYGEGELETRFYPSLKKAALEGKDFPMTKGEQVRDFINVTQVAKRFVKELDFSDVQAGIPFIDNVGTGKPQSLREFAEYWWKKWNAKGKLKFGELPYRENEVMRYVPLIKNDKL